MPPVWDKLFAVKAIFHIGAISALLWLFWGIQSGSLGAEPVERIIHFTGMGALNFLVLTLMITPLSKKLKWAGLIQSRRLVGLYCCFYATLHILAFLALDLLFDLGLWLQEMVSRPYIVVGGLAYLLILAMAVTSIKKLRRKMGKRWQQLHNAIYICAFLIPVHFYWSMKSGWVEPFIYFFGVLFLLATRLKKLKLRV